MLPTARFDEHRLSKNTMGLVCALGEQRKLPSLPIHHFAEPSSGGAVRFHPSLKQWLHIQPLTLSRAQGLTRLIHPILVCAFGSKGDQQPLRPSFHAAQ